ELQGIITEAVEDLRRVQEANSKDGVHQPNAKANATPNSTMNSNDRVHEPNPAPNSTHRVQEGNSTDPDRVRVANSAKESFPPHPPSKKTTLSGGEVENTSAHARGTSLVTVNCEAIYGPNFTLSFAAIDQCAALSGISKERARGIAEICAWDWASNGVKPQAPMAMVRKAIQNDRNSEEIHQAQLAKARS